MPTGICYRCGYCCCGCPVPKHDESDLNPSFLTALALRHGDAYAAEYARANTVTAGDPCHWLARAPDGVTTSCTAYERRSAVCRMHNADGACLVGYLVMRQYGFPVE